MGGDEYKKILVLLESIRKTSDDNNRILRKMRRDAMVGAVVKFILWAILLLSPLYFYYQYKPTIDLYMEKIQEIYGIVSPSN